MGGGWARHLCWMGISSISVVAAPSGHKVDKGHGLHRAQLQQCCECSRTVNESFDAFVGHNLGAGGTFWWQHCGNHLLEEIVEILMFIRSTQMQHESMLWLLALYRLLSSLFPAETLSSLYQDSAVSPPPLAPSVMTFLFQPEQKSHTPFSIVAGLKTHLIKRDVMSPTQLPFLPSSFSICTYLEVKNKLFIS